MTSDLEILALKAETSRLEIESYLVLGQLETHHLRLYALVEDLRDAGVYTLASVRSDE